MDSNGQQFTQFSHHILTLAQELFKTIQYREPVEDLATISDQSNYYFSRLVEKYYSSASSFLKLTNIFQTLRFSPLEASRKQNAIFDKIEKESQIDLISVILRQLVEMYLEVKSIKISLSKGADIENISSVLIHYYRYQYIKEQLENAKEFSGCEPKYLKLLHEAYKTSMEDTRLKASKAGYPLLKKINKKFADVVRSSDFDRLILGRDFLTLYSFISKKVHFSINSTFAQEPYTLYFYSTWAVLYFHEIFFEVYAIRGATLRDELIVFRDGYSQFKQSVDVSGLTTARFVVGGLVLTKFGIARIEELNNLSIKISYLVSNCFSFMDEDRIPGHFVIRVLVPAIFDQAKIKYTGSADNETAQRKLIDEQSYERFWVELGTTKDDGTVL